MSDLVPATGAPPSFELSILSGPHRGVSVALPGGVYRVGSGNDADIVLSDAALAPLHARITLDITGVRVAALGGSAWASAERHAGDEIRPGEERRLSFPAVVAFGASELSFAAPPTPARTPSGHPALRIAAGFAGAAVLLPLAVCAAGITGWERSSSAPAPSPPVAATRAALPSPGSVDEASEALRHHLSETGLADMIKVSAAGETVLAQGTLDPARAPDWLSAESWYDATYGTRTVLVTRVAVTRAAVGPSLSIQGVWAGTAPYVILGDGEKYAEGAVIEGGWTIERIEAHRLILSRNAQTFVLTY